MARLARAGTGILAVVVLLSFAPNAALAQSPYTASSAKVSATDGAQLHVDIFRPAHLASDVRTPVVMVIGPYFDGHGVLGVLNVLNQAEEVPLHHLVTKPDLIGAGYTVVQASMRGFGRSMGCMDFGGTRDQADVKTLIEWAAEQPWSTGRVGVTGMSYEAWAGVMALAARPRGLTAVVIHAPLISAYKGLFMNGVHYNSVHHKIVADYAARDLAATRFMPLNPGDVPAYMADTATGGPCHAQNLAMTNAPDPTLPYWRERDLVTAAAGSDVPVMWTHGFLDGNTKPDNFLDVWTTLRGPKRAWFGHFVHDVPADTTPAGDERMPAETLRWFDRYLKQTSAPVEDDAPVWVQEDEGAWRAEATWPPADVTKHSWPLLAGQYLDAPGNFGQRGAPNGLPGVDLAAVPTPTGVGSWTFTHPLPHQVHIAGTPRVDVQLTAPAPQATMIALLYDVAPDGKARLISRGARTLGVEANAKLELYPTDWMVPPGHRVGILLSGSDHNWFDPGATGRPVLVGGGTWSVPYVQHARGAWDDGELGDKELGVATDRRIDVDATVAEQRSVDAPPPPPQERREH